MSCLTSELSSPNLSFPHPPSIYGPCKVHSNWVHLQLATHSQDLSHYLPSPMAHLWWPLSHVLQLESLFHPAVWVSSHATYKEHYLGFCSWLQHCAHPGTPQKPHSNSRWCQRWKRSSYSLCAPYEASSCRPPPHSPSTHPAWGCGQVMLVRVRSGFLSARTSPYPTIVMFWGI